MEIVDSQIHIWGPELPGDPWPKDAKPHRVVPPTKEQILQEMDAAGVDRCILVPAMLEGFRNNLALDAAQAHPDRFAVVGRFDFQAKDASSQLDTWLSQKGMLGLRLPFNNPDLLRPLTEGRADWVWPKLQEKKIPVYVMATHATAHIFDSIAERYPGLSMILDHLAVKTGAKVNEGVFSELGNVLAMAKRPNVAVKVSALPTNSSEPYPFSDIHKYVRQTYDAFGPERMFWGSDVTRLECTYRQCVTMFTEEMPWLTSNDLELIMGKSLRNWLNWRS